MLNTNKNSMIVSVGLSKRDLLKFTIPNDR